MANDSHDSSSSVIRNTGLMTLGTLGSRVTGLVRTWAMAFALGNSMLTSAYQVANNLPNVMYELVAGGFLSAAFLPVLLLEREQRGQEGANRYTSNILNLTLIVLGALSLLCCAFAPQVVSTQTFTVGDEAEVAEATTEFFRIFAFQIVFYGLGGVITGVLNAGRSFFLTSIAPALNNIVVIVSFIAYIPLSHIDSELALIVLAVGTTAGVAVQFVIQIPALLKSGYKWEPFISLSDPAIKETLKIALPSIIYIIANLVAFSFRNAFSLAATPSGPSILGYAWMWYQLPYGVVAVSLSSTMFTEMSDSVAKGDREGLLRNINQGLRGTLYLIIPLTGMLFVLAEPLMGLFHAGAFGSSDVEEVASVLAIWVLSLPIYSAAMYLYKAFAAIRKLMAFSLINIACVGVQVALYATLSQPDVLGIYGVPVSDFVYYLVRGIASLVLLRHYVGAADMRGLAWMAAKTAVATVIGGVVVWAALEVMPLSSTAGIASALVQIVVGGIVGLAVMFGGTKLLHVEEFRVIDTLAGKLKRRGAR
ncbi:MAG: murein biosynthesis integral membrane protein MurJ [Eggerthellaceae bacterium]|nr:murein biosynthesis integral membrane protein MurJ [Eggerthellaceae bacterium]